MHAACAMNYLDSPLQLLNAEARALLTRLARVKPFALQQPAVPAARISPPALAAIEHYLAIGRRELRRKVRTYLKWLRTLGPYSAPSDIQRQFTVLRLQFNAVLAQFDIFSDVFTQRSQHEIGVWLAGLDAVAADALTLPGDIRSPAVVCYLDRGAGAAIRRARTRLPGGGENPVAIVRIPRERMVGSGIASSLVHEVGHQAAALLDLTRPLRMELQEKSVQYEGDQQNPWRYWERWISEILADLWSVAKIGIGSTLGLMAVVSLPRAFVFRLNLDDPHPTPWIRVKLSCALGRVLYPDPQWDRLARTWESLYPLHHCPPGTRVHLTNLEAGIEELVGVLLNHRPAILKGSTLYTALALQNRQCTILRRQYRNWRALPMLLYRAPPTLVFAVIGQARADGDIDPQQESELLAKLLSYWALRNTLDTATVCDGMRRLRSSVSVT